MTSQAPLLLIGLLLLTDLPIAECHDGTPFLSVGGVLVMIIFTCCLCMCYRRMYEQRMAMAEAAHAPQAVIITCQGRRSPGASTITATPAHITYTGSVHMPYSPSPHFNPYAPRTVGDLSYGHYESTSTTQRPATVAATSASGHAQVQLPPPSYESLFPAQNNQASSGNQVRGNDGNEVQK